MQINESICLHLECDERIRGKRCGSDFRLERNGGDTFILWNVLV